MKFDDLKKIINDADMVLVGIGEDFEEKNYLLSNAEYSEKCSKIAELSTEWVMPYVNRLFLQSNGKLQRAYGALEQLLEGKNYFILTTCMDGFIRQTGLKQERIVEPCGSYTKMQCKKGCTGSLQATEDKVLKEIASWDWLQKGFHESTDTCKICGSPLVLNSLYAEHYMEEGYQQAWTLYTKWLQGTLNKKLCILELGSGMMFANVLRFRFEKIAGLNQKASLIRIHKSLYQLPEEISGKGLSVTENAVEYMAELC